MNCFIDAQTQHGRRNGTFRPAGDRKPPSPAEDTHHLTDLGNARRVAERHGRDLRYIYPWKRWLVWDGQRWVEDATGEVVRRVKDTQGEFYEATLRRLQELRGTEPDGAEQASAQKIFKFALKWEDARAINRTVELLKSELPLSPESLDRHPLLLNVNNGTVDLNSGQLQPHRREDYLTKLAPVDYDPDAECPLWDRFLDRITAADRDLIAYLQRVIGYGLTGDVSEHCLWVYHGAGANGKSTFLLTVQAMLGDYAMQAAPDLLIKKRHEAHPTAQADLFGKRFVCSTEVERGDRLAESLMKQLTGGDRVRGRRLYQESFEFEPTHKITIATNHKPTIHGTDNGTWRRPRLVPFDVTIPPAEQDKQLLTKLRNELPGILAWAVRGCLAWQKIGLAEPESVRRATAAYRAEQDTIRRFLDERCEVRAGAKVNATVLLDAYVNWSGDRDTKMWEFNDGLKSLGHESKRTAKGYFWLGIGLVGN